PSPPTVRLLPAGTVSAPRVYAFPVPRALMVPVGPVMVTPTAKLVLFAALRFSVPPAMVKVVPPSAPALPATIVPALRTMLVTPVLSPPKVRVPSPALVRVIPAPLRFPWMLLMPPPKVQVCGAVSTTTMLLSMVRLPAVRVRPPAPMPRRPPTLLKLVVLAMVRLFRSPSMSITTVWAGGVAPFIVASAPLGRGPAGLQFPGVLQAVPPTAPVQVKG